MPWAQLWWGIQGMAVPNTLNSTSVTLLVPFVAVSNGSVPVLVSGSTGFTSAADILTCSGPTRRYDVKITGTYLAAQATRWGAGIMKTGVYVDGSASWVTSVIGNLYTITSFASVTLSSTDTIRVCRIQ